MKNIELTSFEQYITVNNKNTKFLFRQFYVAGRTKYFITCTDPQDQYIGFEMREVKRNKWIAIPPVPEWIMNIEDRLSQLIVDHEHENL